MARRFASFAALVVAGLSVGCMSNKIKTFAANDMQCSFGQVQIEDLENGAYRASGCGKTADYYCNGKNCVRAQAEAPEGGKAKKVQPKESSEEPSEPGSRWVKKGPAKFKLKTEFLKDGSDGDTYKDPEAHHVVKLKVAPFKGSDDDYFDQTFPEAKRFTEGSAKLATKMDGGGSRRLTVAAVVRDGKVYELSCTFDDAASTKTDAVCLDVLKSFKVSAAEQPADEE